MRIARDQYGLKDEYIDTLNQTTTQVRSVGITLNQIARNSNSQSANFQEIPTIEIIQSIKEVMKGVRVLRELCYRSN